MTKTPLVGKQVTIVCDEATLQELYKLNDHQWDNFNEGEFMFFIGGTIDGPIAPSMTDVARGQTIIVNGTNVTLTLTPSQDELAAASYYFLGGHEYEISNEQAQVLINAGYGDYVTPIV